MKKARKLKNRVQLKKIYDNSDNRAKTENTSA